MKKVLVVGSNGFLGTRLAIALATKGYQVVALVDRRFPYDSIRNMKNIYTIEFVLEEIDLIEGGDLLMGIDTLYHFAWAGVGANFRNQPEIQVQNVMFGLKILEFAERNHIKRVIIPGSAAESSCSSGIITGKELPAPSDMYSAAKVATRYVCQTYALQHDIDLIWALVTSVYGPGRDDNNLISYVISTLLKGEKPSTTGLEQQWDYLYIDDLINAFILLGEKGKGGKIYPIGSGEHKLMREYVEIIRNIINPHLPLGIGEIPYKNPSRIDNQIFDISELVSDTGFSAQYDFYKGINETINYFKTLI